MATQSMLAGPSRWCNVVATFPNFTALPAANMYSLLIPFEGIDIRVGVFAFERRQCARQSYAEKRGFKRDRNTLSPAY